MNAQKWFMKIISTYSVWSYTYLFMDTKVISLIGLSNFIFVFFDFFTLSLLTTVVRKLNDLHAEEHKKFTFWSA